MIGISPRPTTKRGCRQRSKFYKAIAQLILTANRQCAHEAANACAVAAAMSQAIWRQIREQEKP